MRKHYAQLAQLVEQRTENPCVSGSIPELGIVKYYGILAQLVEHLTFNQVVRGSNPRCFIKQAEIFYKVSAVFITGGYGGIGRRAGFRYQWASRAGSSPVIRIKEYLSI